MSNLITHMESELALISDAIATPRMKAAIVELADATVDQYDSGASAPYGVAIVMDLFKRAASFEPLTPIEDRAEHWNEVYINESGTPVFQHRRDSRVFKDGELGRPYAIGRVVWQDKAFRRGGGFTGWDSKRYVQLPWKPSEPKRRWKMFRWPNRWLARLSGRLVTT